MSDQRALHLKQLANIVIDAYANRNQRFKPMFGGAEAVLYLARPEGGDPNMQVGYWYQRDDFEPEERS
jgi:hypothetical protein